jgi:DNA-binding XRE family transcriptional regulator
MEINELTSKLLQIETKNLDKKISVCIEIGEYFENISKISDIKKSDRGYYIVLD